MKYLIQKTVALFLIVGSMAANAAVMINVTESGSDVFFDTSGSLDITGASFQGGIGYSDGIISGGSNWYVGSGTGNSVDSYALTGFDGAFGTNLSFISNPSSVFGDDFFIWGNGGDIEQVGVEVGYTSGDAILSGMVFSNTTIAGLGMITGIYDYLLPNDTITLNIGGAVPEPSIIALFIVGLSGLGLARRRKLS